MRASLRYGERKNTTNLERSTKMKLNGNEIRPGNVILHQDRLWVAVKTQSVKPGKGGAFAQVELKDIVSGTKLNERFRAAETVERVQLEQKEYQFLYAQGDELVFMDMASYEQLELQADFVGDRAAFLQDGMMIEVESYEGKPLGVKLPQFVTLEVKETEPVVKGQTAANSFKPALLENGVKVMVPPFVGEGEKIVVDTTEVTYSKRAE